MRVGVTGGAGYIGAHVVADLLEAGHEVVVLDNMSSGRSVNLEGRDPDRFSFIRGDIREESALLDFFDRGLEVVFHFAASKAAGESMQKPELYSDNNIRGTLALLQAMVRHQCNNFVFSSSAAVYGTPEYLPLDEAHPCHPENYYGFTKLVIEQNLEWFSRLRGIRYAALRYFNAAGYDLRGRVKGLERDPQNLLPIVLEVVVGKRPGLQVFGTDYDTSDGTCVRDYIHVNDLSRAHVRAMDYIVSQKQDLVVNLGSETGLTVREMLATARRVTGHPIPHEDAPRRPGDPPTLVATAARARELLNWKTEQSSAEALIESTWQAYREQS